MNCSFIILDWGIAAIIAFTVSHGPPFCAGRAFCSLPESEIRPQNQFGGKYYRQSYHEENQLGAQSIGWNTLWSTKNGVQKEEINACEYHGKCKNRETEPSF